MDMIENGGDQKVPVEPAKEHETTSALVQPATVQVKATFPQGGISIRVNQWLNWALIAIRAEARAIQAHGLGLAAKRGAEFLESETLETMIAVTAVRHSFHHLYLDWHAALNLDPNEDSEKDVPQLATDDLPEDDEDLRLWLDGFKNVVDDRNELVHTLQKSEPVEEHPIGTSTSAFAVKFQSGRATAVVDLMLDFYRRVLTAPSPELRVWADDRTHVLGLLEDRRSKYIGETEWNARPSPATSHPTSKNPAPDYPHILTYRAPLDHPQ